MSIMNTLDVADIRLSGPPRTAEYFFQNAHKAAPVQTNADAWKDFASKSELTEFQQRDRGVLKSSIVTNIGTTLFWGSKLTLWLAAPAVASGLGLALALTSVAAVSMMGIGTGFTLKNLFQKHAIKNQATNRMNTLEVMQNQGLIAKAANQGPASATGRYIPPNQRPS